MKEGQNITKEKLRNQVQQETNPSAKIPILTTYGGTKNEKLTTYGGTKNKYLQLMAEQKTNTENFYGVTNKIQRNDKGNTRTLRFTKETGLTLQVVF